MGWEQRLREMVLAGGTLATAGCSSSSAGSAFGAAQHEPGDATTDTASEAPTGGNFCCNVNPDPVLRVSRLRRSAHPRVHPGNGLPGRGRHLESLVHP